MLFLVLGMLVGALLLVATFMGLKWLVAVCLVLAGLFVLAMVAHTYRSLERFLLLAFIPLSSLKIDVHLLRVGGEPAFAITPLTLVWGLLMILWFVRFRQGKASVVLRSGLAVPLLIILVGSLVACARSDSLVMGMRGLFQVSQCLSMFVYLVNRKTTEREAQLFFWAICLTLGAQSLLGVLQGTTGGTFGSQYFGGGKATYTDTSFGGVSISRVGGSIGHSNAYALYLNSLIFVPFAAMVARRSGLSRSLGSAVFLLGVVALAMSKSRGSWVGFAFCFLLFAFILFRERIGAPKAVFVVFNLMLLSAALVLVTPATRVRLFTDDYGAAQSRIPMSMTALNMIVHHPLLGVGSGNYELYHHDYDRTPEGHTYQFQFPVHNAFLLTAAELGIPVLLAYLAVLFGVWRAAFRYPGRLENPRSRTVAVGLGIGLLAQAIIWQVEIASPSTNLYTWFLMGLAFSLSRVDQPEVAGVEDTVPSSGQALGDRRGDLMTNSWRG